MSVRILNTDALSGLPGLPDDSVQCCVTSPPYWGLRSYGGDPSMIGLEPTLDEHLDNLVAVFREVRRVLRPDGCVFLNYGDAYASSGANGAVRPGANRADGKVRDVSPRNRNGTPAAEGCKPKDLMMLPARVALALQADGWWLRSEIVLAKKNPMPESCTDRPTSAHEKMFLLTKQPSYFYDADAVRTPSGGNHGKARPTLAPEDAERQSRNGRREALSANLRNVWWTSTEGFPDAHFAVMPTAWVKPCIKAGTSERGCCVQCGAPWVRETERRLVRTPKGNHKVTSYDVGHETNNAGANRARDGHKNGWARADLTTGWRPTCECSAETRPCVVLDPFAGAGTVGLVADRLGRDAVLIEINAEYAEMARRRIQADAPLFAKVS